jgi:Domain of unknown function (DUF4357)
LFGPGNDGEGSRIYIGEGDPVRPRLENHHSQKDFWTGAVFFISTQGQLNKAHVQYLESRLVAIAKIAKRGELDNSQTPTEPSLSEHEKAEMEVFLANMLGMLPILGISAFDKPDTKPRIENRRLYLQAKGIQAEGYDSTQGFTVLMGSLAVKDVTNSFNEGSHGTARALREQLLKNGVLLPNGSNYQFTSDFSFNSPSLASSIIVGNASNGRILWRDKNGRTLKELQELESSSP